LDLVDYFFFQISIKVQTGMNTKKRTSFNEENVQEERQEEDENAKDEEKEAEKQE